MNISNFATGRIAKTQVCLGQAEKDFIPRLACFTSTRPDVFVVGFHGGNQEFRVAASATRAYVGEPIEFNGTYTSGVASANTVVQAADATPVIATDNFVGILQKDFEVNSSGTVTAHKTLITVPIAHATRLRAKALTASLLDTDSELLGLLWDLVLFNLASGTFTIDQTAAADTSGLIIRNGNIVKGTLDVVVDARAMRADVST